MSRGLGTSGRKNDKIVGQLVKIYCFSLTRHEVRRPDVSPPHMNPNPPLDEDNLPHLLLGRPPDNLQHRVHLIQHLGVEPFVKYNKKN